MIVEFKFLHFLTCTRPIPSPNTYKQDTSVLYYNTWSLSVQKKFFFFFFFSPKTRENVSPSAAERFRFYSCAHYKTRGGGIQDKRYQHYVFVSFDISFLVSPVFSYHPLPLCFSSSFFFLFLYFYIVEKRFPAFPLTGRNI